MSIGALDRPDFQERPTTITEETARLLADLQTHADHTPGSVGERASRLKNELASRVAEFAKPRAFVFQDEWAPKAMVLTFLRHVWLMSAPAPVSDEREELIKKFLNDCRKAGVDGSYLVWAIRENRK